LEREIGIVDEPKKRRGRPPGTPDKPRTEVTQ
jgi:hypothetical protein